jgi:hypothetical protein
MSKEKPVNCTCGGTASDGSCIECSICNRVVLRKTREEAVSRWNKAIEEEIKGPN